MESKYNKNRRDKSQRPALSWQPRGSFRYCTSTSTSKLLLHHMNLLQRLKAAKPVHTYTHTHTHTRTSWRSLTKRGVTLKSSFMSNNLHTLLWHTLTLFKGLSTFLSSLYSLSPLKDCSFLKFSRKKQLNIFYSQLFYAALFIDPGEATETKVGGKMKANWSSCVSGGQGSEHTLPHDLIEETKIKTNVSSLLWRLLSMEEETVWPERNVFPGQLIVSLSRIV